LQEIVILELPKVPEENDGTALWPWLKFFKCQTMEEMNMLASRYKEVSDAVWQVRRMSPIRAIREMIFEYYDARNLREGQDEYVREQGYKEAELKYQEKLTAAEDQIRQLEEEVRRLQGE
jgi:hypothetical protein